MRFDRTLDAPYGEAVPLSPLVARLLAPNPGPFTFKGTGVYIIGDGAQVMVIDPGPDDPVHLAALKRAIGARTVSHILVTHTHRDHSPAAAPLKAWSGAPTYGFGPHVSSPSALRIASASARGRYGPGTSPADRSARGGGRPVLGEAEVEEGGDRDFVPDVVATDGMLIGGEGFWLEAVHTPGHTANHVCYGLVQEQALFSGDHVMGWSTSVVAPPDGNMGDYLASLEKLAARDDRILYPTHGSPITNPRQWLGELIAHRRMREAQVLAALARGDDTVAALVEKLYPELGAGLAGAAAAQMQAHLDHLVEQGRAATDGDFRYRPLP